MARLMLTLTDYIAAVPDFPKPGILFRDITPLLAHPEAFDTCLEELRARIEPLQPTHIMGIESRGFIFGAPIARQLKLPFILARKPGKLPRETYDVTYQLEYGEDQLSVHRDDLPAEAHVLIIDDLLATGGTAEACSALVHSAEATVAGLCFVIELTALEGRQRLEGALKSQVSNGQQSAAVIESLITY